MPAVVYPDAPQSCVDRRKRVLGVSQTWRQSIIFASYPYFLASYPIFQYLCISAMIEGVCSCVHTWKGVSGGRLLDARRRKRGRRPFKTTGPPSATHEMHEPAPFARVLSPEETEKYLGACPQPWRDVATTILDEGFRPSEVFSLRWEHITFQGRGFIRITDSKSKAGRRTLPMTSCVYELLSRRHAAQREPKEGWVFPSTRRQGISMLTQRRINTSAL